VGLGTGKIPGDGKAIKFLFVFFSSASLSPTFIFCSGLALVQKGNVMFRFFPLKMRCPSVGLHDRRTPEYGWFQDFSTVEIMKIFQILNL